jgi:hypothetical protein
MIVKFEAVQSDINNFVLRAFRGKVSVFLTVVSTAFGISCNSFFPTQTKPDVPKNHTMDISGVLHKSGLREPMDRSQGCSMASCHGSDLRGGVAMSNGRKVVAPSCTECHGALWENGGGNDGEDD